MKIEPRGKYGGVKIHLEPEECELFLALAGKIGTYAPENEELKKQIFGFSSKMGMKIKDLLAKEPDLLAERTPEQVKAILAKEVEKAKMQLDQVNAGLSHKEVDKEALKKALLKHAE